MQLDLFGNKISRKEILLNKLRGKGRYKYSRYTGLPLRYAGGKSLGVGYIIENIPDNIRSLVSPFLGGSSVEIACANELNIQVKGYDIFDILTNYWKIQIDSPQLLADKLEEWQPTKEQYNRIKSRLKEHWNKENIIEERDGHEGSEEGGHHRGRR